MCHKTLFIRLLQVYYLSTSVLGPTYPKIVIFALIAPLDSHRLIITILSFNSHSSAIHYIAITLRLTFLPHRLILKVGMLHLSFSFLAQILWYFSFKLHYLFFMLILQFFNLGFFLYIWIHLLMLFSPKYVSPIPLY